MNLHLKEKNHSFEDNSVNILTSEDGWFERGVLESIDIKLERPSLTRGAGLRYYLSPAYDTVLSSLPRQLNNYSHLRSSTPRNPHKNLLGQQPTSGPNDSETQSSYLSLTTLEENSHRQLKSLQPPPSPSVS